MKRTLAVFAAIALVWSGSLPGAIAAGVVPLQLAQAQDQTIAAPPLSSALQAQVNQAVQQAIAANTGAAATTIANAIAAAIGGVVAANAAAIAADPTLAVSIAQAAVVSLS